MMMMMLQSACCWVECDACHQHFERAIWVGVMHTEWTLLCFQLSSTDGTSSAGNPSCCHRDHEAYKMQLPGGLCTPFTNGRSISQCSVNRLSELCAEPLSLRQANHSLREQCSD
jgi:hypothetical protein